MGQVVGEGCPSNSWRFAGGEESRGGSRDLDFRLGIRWRRPQEGDHHDEGELRERDPTGRGRAQRADEPPTALGTCKYLLPLVNVSALAGGALDQVIEVIDNAHTECAAQAA